jgi:hypothetical protein
MDNKELDQILDNADGLLKEMENAYSLQNGRTNFGLVLYNGIKALYEQNKVIIELLRKNPNSKIDYGAIEEKLLK